MRDIKKLLGKRIRELRKIKGLTQEQLAELVGIGTANISYIETGKNSPSIETFSKLSDVLGVYPYELYMFEHFRSTDELKNELIDALNKDSKLVSMMYKFYQLYK